MYYYDDAYWRRPIIFPIRYTVPENQRDPNLLEKLKSQASEALLAWMVEGAVRWCRTTSLDIPESLHKALQDYRESMDHFTLFFKQCCERVPDGWEAISDVQGAYHSWCSEHGKAALSKGAFRKRMIAAGIKPCKRIGGTVRAWEGIELKDKDEEDAGHRVT